jgi:hypothetical protein
VNTVMNLRVPYIAGKFLSGGCTVGGFPRRAQLHEVSFILSGFLKIRATYEYMVQLKIYTSCACVGT